MHILRIRDTEAAVVILSGEKLGRNYVSRITKILCFTFLEGPFGNIVQMSAFPRRTVFVVTLTGVSTT